MTLDIKKILSLLFIPIYLSLIVILLILNIEYLIQSSDLAFGIQLAVPWPDPLVCCVYRV